MHASFSCSDSLVVAGSAISFAIYSSPSVKIYRYPHALWRCHSNKPGWINWLLHSLAYPLRLIAGSSTWLPHPPIPFSVETVSTLHSLSSSTTPQSPPLAAWLIIITAAASSGHHHYHHLIITVWSKSVQYISYKLRPFPHRTSKAPRHLNCRNPLLNNYSLPIMHSQTDGYNWFFLHLYHTNVLVSLIYCHLF